MAKNERDSNTLKESLEFEQLLFDVGETEIEIPENLSDIVLSKLDMERDRIIKNEIKRNTRFLFLKGSLLAVSILLAVGVIFFDLFRTSVDAGPLDFQAYTSILSGTLTIKNPGEIEKTVDNKSSFTLKENEKITLDKECKVVIYPQHMGSITAVANTVLTPISLPGDKLHIKLHSGSILASVNPLKVKDSFMIETYIGNITVKGTVFKVTVSKKQTLNVNVHEGVVHVDLKNFDTFQKNNFPKKVEQFYNTYKNHMELIHSNDFYFLSKLEKIINDGIDIHKNENLNLSEKDLNHLNNIFITMVKSVSHNRAVISDKDILFIDSLFPDFAQTQKFLPRSRWKTTLPSSLWSSPIKVKNSFFSADKDGNTFLIKKDGSIKARHTLPAGIQSTAAFGNGLIVVSAMNGKIYFLDSETLEQRGVQDIPSSIGAAVIYSDEFKVFFTATHTGEIFCFNRKKVMWHTATVEGIYTTPVIQNNDLIITSQNGKMFAFNLLSGRPKWSSSIGFRTRMAQIVTDNNVLFITSGNQGELKAISAIDGSTLWTKTLNIKNSTLLNDKSRLIVIGKNGKIFSLNKENGSILWNKTLKFTISGKPILVAGNIVIPSNKALYVYNSDTGIISEKTFCKTPIENLYNFNRDILGISSNGDIQYFYTAKTKNKTHI